MNNQRFIIIATLAAGLLATAAYWAAVRKHAAETNRSGLAARRAELTGKLRPGEAEVVAAKKRREERAAASVVEPAPAPVAFAEPAAPGPRAASSFLEWMEDPKVQALWFAKERADLATSYGPFFREHRLSPAQIDRLSDLIVQSRAHTHDMSELNRLKGLSFNDSAMVAQRNSGDAEMRAGVTALLGESGYAELKDYARALEVRTYVGKLAGRAAVEGVPLNLEQANALVRALASTCPGYALGGPANVNRIDWKAAEAQAQGILSREQMRLLHTEASGAGPSRMRVELGQAVLRAARELEAAGGRPSH